MAKPRVVIIGGGFGGLYAARTLRASPVDITLLDRRNHHLFQPMLYQVATASLSPAQIAAPIRKILARQANCRVILAEAVAIDPVARVVKLADGEQPYDYLILAAGMANSYIGHDAWAAHAPGLKSVEDALEVRHRFLLAFERAERETDPEAIRAALTFVVVGGGPTGVETAGAMAEIARRSIPREFRLVNTAAARVILIEAGARVLAAFPPDLSAAGLQHLKDLGVEVRLSSRVEVIDDLGVVVRGPDGPERIDAGTVVWAAGVRGAAVAATLGVPLDRAGRVPVGPDLSIPNHPEVFVVGDLAAATDVTGRPTPGVCPAAMQMGSFAAGIIDREARAAAAAAGPARAGPARPAFRYVNRGELATIGRARAVGVIGFGFGAHLKGWVAWALWAGVHITYLIGFRSRLLVLIDWAWAYIVFERGARLITGDTAVRLRTRPK